MRYFLYIFSFIVFLTFTACKSDFEKVRSSNDTELIYAKAMEYFDQGLYFKAQSLIELVMNAYRGSEKGEDLFYKYAETYYEMGDYFSASHHFGSFSASFPSSLKKEDADFKKAYANYLQSPTFRLDQTKTIQAIEDLQTFINTYPQSERVPECNVLIDEMRDKLAKKGFEQGKLYYSMQQYEAAVQTLQNLIIDYPDYSEKEEANWLIVKSCYEFATNSIYEKREERYNKTVDVANRFIQKFPDSHHLEEVKSYLVSSNQLISKIL